MFHKILILLFLALPLYAQQSLQNGNSSPVMELSYFPAPSSPSSAITTINNAGVLSDVVLECFWGNIDTDGIPAHYNYSSCDTQIASYVSTYSNVNIQLLFAPASDISPNSATPAYVMQDSRQHVCACPSYAGSGAIVNSCVTGFVGVDLTASPFPVDLPFATNWNNFVANTLTYYKNHVNGSRIRSITFGEQRGGENIPTCSSVVTSLVNPSTTAGLEAAWVTMNQRLNQTEATNPVPFLVFDGVGCIGISQPSTSNNCDLADKVAAVHFQYGIGFRFTCVKFSDLTNWQAQAPTCGDWVNLISTYPNVVAVDLQDATQSDPSGDSCTLGGQASKVGDLIPLLSFIMQHRGAVKTFIYEAISSDLNGAYTGNTNACWASACFTGSCPYSHYDKAIRYAEQGFPLGSHVVR